MHSNLINPNKQKLKKKFSQVFLINNNILKKIAEIIHNNKLKQFNEFNIVEIGAGSGNLTKYLKAKKILIYEIDKDYTDELSLLINKLKKNNSCKYKLVIDDVLRKDIFIKNINNLFNNDEYIIVGNLPYHIESKIIYQCLSMKKWKRMFFLISNEFAKRIINKKKQSIHNIIISCFGTLTIELIVKNKDFYPIPKIDSALIKIVRNDDYKYMQNELFYKFLNLLFLWKRKNLLNVLSKILNNRENAANVLNEQNINFNVRAENLTKKQMYNLFLRLKLNKNLFNIYG